MPLVTVVTAAKNAAAFLPATIESIRSQTLSDWRHVIVDDGSDDETRSVVDHAASHDSRIVLVRREDSVGPYAAANSVMLGADSKYLARIDADDVAFPTRLADQVEALERSGRRACAGAWQPLLADGSTLPVRRVPSTSCGVLKWLLWLGNPFVHSTMVIETDYFAELGGYGPARVSEDHRLWSRLTLDGAVTVVDSPTVQYRFSRGQMTAQGDILDDPVRVRIHLAHVQACGFADATSADARDLRHLCRDALLPARRALELLKLWTVAWNSDAALSEGERRELSDYAAMRAVSHLRLALRTQPLATASVAATQLPFLTPRVLAALRRRGGRLWR